MTEPEAAIHYFCPKAETVDHGDVLETTHPQMALIRSTDDEAGRTRVFLCPKCKAEFGIHFPPD